MSTDLEGLVLDGLDLNDAANFSVEQLAFKPAQKLPSWADNPDADGAVLGDEPHYSNSEFSMGVRIVPRVDMDTALLAHGRIQDKLQKASLQRDAGGIPLVWTPNGASRSFTYYALLGELEDLPLSVDGDLAGWFVRAPLISIHLVCRPFAFTAERVIVSPIGSTTPLQEVLLEHVGGDVGAEGRLIVTEASSQDRRHLEWGLDQIDGPAATNLITNPRAAIDTTGWGGVGLIDGPTRIEPATPLELIGADTAVWAQTDADGDYLYHSVAVTAGAAYRFSIYVQLSALSATGVRPVIYNASGASRKATGTALASVSSEGWSRLDVSFTADATATWRVGIEQQGAGSASFAVVGAMVEASATLTAYLDGDMPNCAWTGSREASSSVRPAPCLLSCETPGSYGNLAISGFAGAAATRTGAYTGDNVIRATLISTPVTICGTGDVAHVGNFRVKARIYAPDGLSRLRASYRVGDGPFRSLSWKTPPLTGALCEVDLGEVSLDRLLRGPQRSEIRVEGKSTGTSTTLEINYLELVPTSHGYGRARSPSAPATALTLSAFDTFDQAGGDLTGGRTANDISGISAANPGVITLTGHGLSNGDVVWIEQAGGTAGAAVNGLRTVANVTTNTFTVGVNTTGLSYASGGKVSKAGKAAGLGGSWYGSGDSDDETIDATNHLAQRTATSDAGLGRLLFIPALGALSTLTLQGDVRFTSAQLHGFNPIRMGLLARYLDEQNWVALNLAVTNQSGWLEVLKSKAGVISTLSSLSSGYFKASATWYTLRLALAGAGTFAGYIGAGSVLPASPSLSGYDADLAAGGTLAAGRAGRYVANESNLAATLNADNFSVSVPPAPSPVISADKELEVRSDAVLRQDAAGVNWGPPPSYRGSRFYVPPAGDGAAVARLAVKLRRADVEAEPDSPVTDNQELAVRIAERYLTPR